MIELYLIFSIIFNLILIFFSVWFFKNNWIDFIAKFKHNAILCYFISDSGNLKKELHTPKNDKFERKAGTYLVDKSKRFFNFPSKTPIYYYSERHSSPLDFGEVQEQLNPELLDNLLIMAKASGSIDWINKLVKFKWIIISFIVMAGGIVYLVYKMNELQTVISALQTAVTALRTTTATLVG